MAGETEFTHVRYTAAWVTFLLFSLAVTDPVPAVLAIQTIFLPSAGYSFRQNKYGRKTELLIAMSESLAWAGKAPIRC